MAISIKCRYYWYLNRNFPCIFGNYLDYCIFHNHLYILNIYCFNRNIRQYNPNMKLMINNCCMVVSMVDIYYWNPKTSINSMIDNKTNYYMFCNFNHIVSTNMNYLHNNRLYKYINYFIFKHYCPNTLNK